MTELHDETDKILDARKAETPLLMNWVQHELISKDVKDLYIDSPKELQDLGKLNQLVNVLNPSFKSDNIEQVVERLHQAGLAQEVTIEKLQDKYN